MRKKEDIEKEFKGAPIHPVETSDRIFQKLVLEVLLDMRELLKPVEVTISSVLKNAKGPR